VPRDGPTFRWRTSCPFTFGIATRTPIDPLTTGFRAVGSVSRSGWSRRHFTFWHKTPFMSDHLIA
jgi:hypothetical protein